MRFAHLKTHHRFERMRLRGISGEQSIVGETPNLAAGLQAIAAPGSLVTSGSDSGYCAIVN
jgi:class 3 adenylate cyclase